MLALVNNEPKTLNLQQLLQYFIDHRRDVVVRRAKYDLRKAQEKAHILEGLLIALQNIDDVVKLIRGSARVDEAKTKLLSQFSLTEIQAQAILEMRLSRLAQMERNKIEEEHKALSQRIAELQHLLSHDEAIRSVIKAEMRDCIEKYGDARKTEIEDNDAADVDIEELIPESMQVVTKTRSGYVKRTAVDIYKTQRRGGKGVIGTEKKEEDVVDRVFVANTHSYLLVFTNIGKVHWLKVWQIPEGSRYSKGKAIVNLLEMSEGEEVSAVIPVKQFTEGFLVMATKQGVIKKTKLSEYAKPRRGGIRAIVFDEGDSLVNVAKTLGSARIMLATRDGLASRFSEDDVRVVGRTARGVRGIKLSPNDVVVGMVVADDQKQLLTVTEKGYGKRTPIGDYRLISRGGKGVINLRISERTGKVACVRSVVESDELLFVSAQGIMLRTTAKNISLIGRNTQGVRVMKLSTNDQVVASARIIEQ